MRLLHPAAVEVRGLRSRGRRRRGDPDERLRGVDLSVPVGARLLVVSRPEGSASLLLRILAGMVRPATGTISLAGVARADDTPLGWRRRVAHVGAQPAIYPWLSPREALQLAARLSGMPRGERERRVDEALERFGMRRDGGRPISRGGPVVAQKTAVAAALLTDPEVLLLDEPLRAADPDERGRLLRLSGRRLTVLLASRYPASEAGLVNQVALIRDGRVALHASIDDLAAAGLPLSGRGIDELAARSVAMSGIAPSTGARAEAASR